MRNGVFVIVNIFQSNTGAVALTVGVGAVRAFAVTVAIRNRPVM